MSRRELILCKRFYEDNPADMVVLDVSTDEEIDLADDLSEVSMVSQGDVTHAELENLLAGISSAHKKMAVAVDALQERVQNMTFEQVDDTAAAVSSEIANIRGISFVTEVFDQEEIALILAVGVRRLQEWQVLQKKRPQGDVTSFARLQEIFGCNARPSPSAERVKSTDTPSQQRENQKAPKKSSGIRGRSTLSDREPKMSRVHLQALQHLSETTETTTQTFGPFQDHQILPKAK